MKERWTVKRRNPTAGFGEASRAPSPPGTSPSRGALGQPSQAASFSLVLGGCCPLAVSFYLPPFRAWTRVMDAGDQREAPQAALPGQEGAASPAPRYQRLAQVRQGRFARTRWEGTGKQQQGAQSCVEKEK